MIYFIFIIKAIVKDIDVIIGNWKIIEIQTKILLIIGRYLLSIEYLLLDGVDFT